MTRSAAPLPRSPRRDVELWYSRCGAATASAIAIRQGWLQAEFARGGTRLRSLRESDDGAIRDAHYHHQLSGFFREGGNIPPIWARSNGAETAVVGITWLDEYQGILSRADGAVRDIGQLAGKRLALPLNRNLIDFQRGAALHGFVTALRLAGAKAEEAQFVDVLPTFGPTTAPRALPMARRRPEGHAAIAARRSTLCWKGASTRSSSASRAAPVWPETPVFTRSSTSTSSRIP